MKKECIHIPTRINIIYERRVYKSQGILEKREDPNAKHQHVHTNKANQKIKRWDNTFALKNSNERRDDPDVSDYLGLFIASVVYE